MIFSKGNRKYENYHFTYKGNKIDITDSYKYLGIALFYTGNLKHAANDLYNKALKAMFSLRKKKKEKKSFQISLNFLQN